MEQKKKNLQQISQTILILIILDIFNLITQVAGISTNELEKTGIPKNLVITIIIITAAVIALAQAFMGFKGLKESKNPTKSKVHIVLAIIFAVLSIIAFVTNTISLVESFSNDDSIFNGIINILINAVDIVLFIMFAKYAIAVQKSE